MADQSEVAMTEQQEVKTQETIDVQTPTDAVDTTYNAPDTPQSDTPQPTTHATATAHLSISSATSITARLQLQTKDNWFTRSMSIEPIQHLVKVEFDTFGGIKLFKAFFVIYIVSLIDIITDILLSITVTRSGSCIPILMGLGAHAMIIIAAWFSTATAIIYSFYFKYLEAFKVMYKQKISFWSAVKYVSLKTALMTEMQYATIGNDTNRYRLMNLFFEDVLQCIIGIIISFNIPRADIFVILSMYSSAAAICYMVSKMIQWRFRDYVRKNCKWCFKNCGKIGVNKICDKTCKYILFGGLAFVVGFLLLVPIWRSYERYEQTVSADYGFVVADVKYHIDYLRINASNSMSNTTINWMDIELKTTIDNDVKYLCIDADSNQFHNGVSFDDNEQGISIDEDDLRSMPVVCFVVKDRRLRIYFVDENENFAECYQSKNKLKWTDDGKTLDENNDFVFYDSWGDDENSEMTFGPTWKIDYSSTNTAYCDNL